MGSVIGAKYTQIEIGNLLVKARAFQHQTDIRSNGQMHRNKTNSQKYIQKCVYRHIHINRNERIITSTEVGLAVSSRHRVSKISRLRINNGVCKSQIQSPKVGIIRFRLIRKWSMDFLSNIARALEFVISPGLFLCIS